jgi:Fe-S-cluster containining protein
MNCNIQRHRSQCSFSAIGVSMNVYQWHNYNYTNPNIIHNITTSLTTKEKVDFCLYRYEADHVIDMDPNQVYDFWNTMVIQLNIPMEQKKTLQKKVMAVIHKNMLDEMKIPHEKVKEVENMYISYTQNLFDVEMAVRRKNLKCNGKKITVGLFRKQMLQFWENIQELLSIPEELITTFRDKIKDKVKLTRWRRSKRLITTGRFYRKPCPIMDTSEKNCQYYENPIDFCRELPFGRMKDMSAEHLQRIKNLQQQIMEAIPDEIKKSQNESHPGKNIAISVCPGGRYKNSYHHSPTLFKNYLYLRLELQQAISDAITDTFGKECWYIKYKKMVALYSDTYDENIKHALVKDIPCTTIWWNTKTRLENKQHIDDNAHGVAFLFCAETYEGGEINMVNPENGEVKTIHMTEGKILAGRWSRSIHWNNPVANDKERFSFVVYFDNRILKDSYTYIAMPPFWLERTLEF